MEQSNKEKLDAALEESARLSEALTKAKQRRELFIRKMQSAPTTFHKMWVWTSQKWFDVILLSLAFVGSGIVLGLIGKLIWEIWLMIFSL